MDRVQQQHQGRNGYGGTIDKRHGNLRAARKRPNLPATEHSDELPETVPCNNVRYTSGDCMSRLVLRIPLVALPRADGPRSAPRQYPTREERMMGDDNNW